MVHEGLTTGKAAAYVGRHPKTLQAMDRRGVLPAKRTSTGKRYWLRSDLDAYLGRTAIVAPRRRIAYCRVSSAAQRPDLKNQRRIVEEFCIAKGIANVDFIEEVGGGLNFRRPKFTGIIDAIVAGEAETLVIAHKDRLARFGFDLLSHLCAKHGCELQVINTEKVSPEQEMVQDLMAITHCFSARLYGLRNYRRALKEALKS
jgi:predicted site-specific integrase-resolvase